MRRADAFPFASWALAIALTSPSVVRAQRGAAVPPTTADVAAKSLPATATVLAISSTGDTVGQGSAFIIREDGVLITNFHVLKGASSAIVVLASRERFTRVRVVDADSALDLAILKIPGAGLPVLPTRTTVPRVGDKAIAIGSPLGLASTVTEGIVSAVRVTRGRELVQISAPISPGSSGGAVVDADGKVFAVSTSHLEGGQAINFAVPVRYALGLLGNRPTERSIADVFAGVAATMATHPSAAAVPLDRLAGFRRAPSPRPSMRGSYQVFQTWSDSMGKTILRQHGVIFATDDIGLIALAESIDSVRSGPTQIYGVERWATNSAGDLVLAAGSVTYDGYQSDDDGFVLYSPFAGRSNGIYLGGIPYRQPLSSNDGLFTVSARTFYEVNGRSAGSGDALNWTGELAIAYAAGRMYVDMLIRNTSGGSTRFYANGDLRGDTFDLTTPSGDRLKGTIRDGLLRAEWTDRRDGGAVFVGTLRAEKR